MQKESRKTKSELLLILYDLLQSVEGITKNSFCTEYCVSSSAFKRYISDIRCYLMENRSYLELLYLREYKTYRIDKPRVQ